MIPMTRPKSRKRLWILLAVVAVILVAAILTTVFCVSAARRRVYSFHGIHVTEELYAYWQARFRYEYLIAHASEGAVDTDRFWDSVKDSDTGLTWRQDCAATTDLLVQRIIIAAYLFDTQGYSLGDAQRETMETRLTDRLAASFNSSKKEYNAAAEKYGFTLTAAKHAAVYEAKANLLASYATASDAQRESYYQANYIRVKMVFVSTDHLHGAETLAALRAGLSAGVDTAQFDRWVSDTAYNDDTVAPETYPEGYYFAASSAFTEEYESYLPEVVEAILSLGEVGDWVEVASDDGVRFIYRYALPETSAYENTTNEAFFTDLTRDAADYYFPLWIDSYASEGVWNDSNKPSILSYGYKTDLYLFFR